MRSPALPLTTLKHCGTFAPPPILWLTSTANGQGWMDPADVLVGVLGPMDEVDDADVVEFAG